MKNILSTRNRFSFVARVKSFVHASRGIGIFFTTTHNAWIQIFVCIIGILFGFYFKISQTEWMFFVLGSGLVFIAEAFNTAIEIDIDLTSPEYHPYARDTKDVAAGAVLLSVVTAVLLGILIFGHYIW